MLFIKISFPFRFAIRSLISPSDDPEKSERTPRDSHSRKVDRQLAKVLLLRLPTFPLSYKWAFCPLPLGCIFP